MSVAVILQLIAFAVTETPVAIAEIQQLIALAQRVNNAQPTQAEQDLISAVAARQAAVNSMPK